MIDDWDDAYAIGAYIDGADEYPPKWASEAEAFRTARGDAARCDLPYGSGARNRFDLFLPDVAPCGLAVFIHGGYWRAFDKSSWSHLAAGGIARGWAVALPSYTLAPAARISEMSREVAAAIEAAAGLVEGPIRLAGHSAGGHLASRMACEGGPLSDETGARVERVVSISGLHDLRPLIRTAMNDDLKLDEAEAYAESPALLRPREGTSIHCWIGADERPELLRQTALLANIWTGLGAETTAFEETGRHHFNVIDGLADPLSPLCDTLYA